MTAPKWQPSGAKFSAPPAAQPAAQPAAPSAAPLSPHAAGLVRRRQADERVLSESTHLIAQARQLDNRLNVATQTDRQLARRAAGLVTQLARRLSVLLSRTATLLPVLPGHGGRRINHFVVHAERVMAGSEVQHPRVRMLTIGSNGMLRVGATDNDASSIVWAEYDPFAPAPGWELEIVIERLSSVVLRVEGHVQAVESRVLERARTLDTLAASTAKKSAAPAAPLPTRNAVAPLLSMSHGRGAGNRAGSRTGNHPAQSAEHAQVSAELQMELDREMEIESDIARTLEQVQSGTRQDAPEHLMEAELDAAISAQVDQIFPTVDTTVDTIAAATGAATSPVAPAGATPDDDAAPVPGSLEDAQARYERSKHRRQLFDRLK